MKRRLEEILFGRSGGQDKTTKNWNWSARGNYCKKTCLFDSLIKYPAVATQRLPWIGDPLRKSHLSNSHTAVRAAVGLPWGPRGGVASRLHLAFPSQRHEPWVWRGTKSWSVIYPLSLWGFWEIVHLIAKVEYGSLPSAASWICDNYPRLKE